MKYIKSIKDDVINSQGKIEAAIEIKRLDIWHRGGVECHL